MEFMSFSTPSYLRQKVTNLLLQILKSMF